MTPNTKSAEQEALEIYHALLLPETYDEKKESMATLASLISDKRRLDWLENAFPVRIYCASMKSWVIHGDGNTFRQDIDQAMKESQS